jgi:hypothetical protein
VSKLYFETDQGDSFELLKGSHIAFKKAGKEDFLCSWGALPVIHGDLDQLLAQGQEMLERMKELLEAHTSIHADH